MSSVLSRDLAKQEFVYRGTSKNALLGYQNEGRIVGPGDKPTYFSLEHGATPFEQRIGTQLPKEPEVLLRIPVSAIEEATVPRPNWGTARIGREYTINSYPQYGAGGYRQFVGTTKTFSNDWIVQGWGNK